jgi:pimeloyl-ACP methyl ester carboxylesterase
VDATFGAWCGLWLDPAFRTWSIEAAADDVTAPLLLVQGADDEYATLDQLARIQSRARGRVERLVVPGGHHPHLEQGERVVEAIAAFAASLTRA